MTAVIIQFPKTSVVRNGGDIGATKPAPTLEQLVDSRSTHVSALDKQENIRTEHVFLRWQNGQRHTPMSFCESSLFAAATSTYGEGPKLFRWAVDATRKPLRTSQTDEALALAVGTLNEIGLLLRYGGLRVSAAGHDEKVGREFAEMAIADIGRTLAMLRPFGAVATPPPGERAHIERVKAKWCERDGVLR